MSFFHSVLRQCIGSDSCAAYCQIACTLNRTFDNTKEIQLVETLYCYKLYTRYCTHSTSYGRTI